MEFRINDCVYKRAGKIDAMTQSDIWAKVAPLLASGMGEFLPILLQLRRDGIYNVGEASLDKLGQIATPIARELAKMSNEDRRFIIGTLLGVAERKRDGEIGWSRVWNVEANRSMYDDINYDFSLMLRIALGIFQETFAGFLPTSLFSLIGMTLTGGSASIR